MEYKKCWSCMAELERNDAVCPVCGYDNAEGPKAQADYALPCGWILNNRYVTGRMLSRSSLCITYIAYDPVSDEAVCIREYFPEGAAVRSRAEGSTVRWGRSQQAQKRMQERGSFAEEARRAETPVECRRIVKVRGSFCENDTVYIVTDYIEGVTLEQDIGRSGKTYTERQCVAMLSPIMQELGQMQARGLVHWNISPDNIIVRADGAAMLLDFGGISAAETGRADLSAIRPSEQTGGGASTDVYAMCAVVYYCITGHTPPTPAERGAGRKPDLRMFTPAFANVLAKGLAVQPKDRIQSMDELLELLREAIIAEPAPISPVWILIGTAAVAVALLAAAAFFLLPRISDLGTKPTFAPIPTPKGILTTEAPAAETADPETQPESLLQDDGGESGAAEETQPEALLQQATEEGTASGEQAVLLTGRFGEEEHMRKGLLSPFYLDRPVLDCAWIKLALRVTGYSGYPYGWFYIYARDFDGRWDHIAQFRIMKDQGNENQIVYELPLDSPQSFTALAIFPAESGMDYTAAFDSEFYVRPDCVSDYSETIPAPVFTPSAVENPFNSTHTAHEWMEMYEQVYGRTAETADGSEELTETVQTQAP